MTGYESRDLINKLNTPCHAAEGNTFLLQVAYSNMNSRFCEVWCRRGKLYVDG